VRYLSDHFSLQILGRDLACLLLKRLTSQTVEQEQDNQRMSQEIQRLGQSPKFRGTQGTPGAQGARGSWRFLEEPQSFNNSIPISKGP
jgi:hypothetical protein